MSIKAYNDGYIHTSIVEMNGGKIDLWCSTCVKIAVCSNVSFECICVCFCMFAYYNI